MSSLPVSSPTPFPTAAPAAAGSAGGTTTVTPVCSPDAACAWPTSTPGTSVIALRSPVGSRPTGPRYDRQRLLIGAGSVQQARRELIAGRHERRVDAVARVEAARAARVEAAAGR